MLVLEGTTLYDKGKPVGKLNLQEGQASEKFVIVESCPGALYEVEPTEAERAHLSTLVEASGKAPKVLLTLEGVFQRADTVNANNRIYPNSIWRKVLEKDGKWLKMVESGDMLGEADHPKDGETLLSRVACMVTDIHRNESNDKEVLGRIVVFDTSKGRDLKAIHEGGGRLGVSSRGQGSVVRMDGKDVVQEDYDLQTWDVVYNPSTPGAYPSEVVERTRRKAEAKALTEAKEKAEVKTEPRPAATTDILRVLVRTKVDTSKNIVESVSEVRDAYRKAVGVEGPLSKDELSALTLYVESAYNGTATVGSGVFCAKITFGGTLTEAVSSVEIRANSEEELKRLVAERMSGIPTFVTVEVDKSDAIYEECATRFSSLLDAQIVKTQRAEAEAGQSRRSITEISAKLSAAKQVIETFAERTKGAESQAEDSKLTVAAAEKLIEAMAQEFYAEGLTAGIAAIAATHPHLKELPEALSQATSLSEAVQITNKVKADNAVFLEREPLGIRQMRVDQALKATKDKEKQLLEQAKTVEKKETPAFKTTKNVVAEMQKRGLK